MREFIIQDNAFTCGNNRPRRQSFERRPFVKNESNLLKPAEFNEEGAACVLENGTEKFCISKKELPRKLILFGDPGEGKTNTFYQVFDRVSRRENSVNIIFDAKGDFYRRFGKGDDCCVIEGFTGNNRDACSFGDSDDGDTAYQEKVVIWNVFDELLADRDNIEFNAREIAKILVGNKQRENRQKFFLDATITLLVLGMLVLSYDYFTKGIKPNNCMLAQFLTSTPEYILERSKEYDLDYMIINIITSANKGEYNGQTLGVIGEVKNIVFDLFVGNFKKPGNFSVKKAIRDGNIRNIFIEYDVTYGRTLSPIYSCLIMLAIKEALGRNLNKKNVNLFIDEFSLLDSIPDMEAAVSFGREQGLFMALSLQHIGQVREKYGAGIADGMLSNMKNIICFKVTDFETREFVKKRFGEKHKQNICYRSLSDRVSLYNLESKISDVDILTLRTGEALISTADSHDVFKFRFKKVKE